MDRMTELAARIKARKQAEQEKTKCSKISGVKLDGQNGHYQGMTTSGKKVYFDRIEFGMSEQGLYGAGTLRVETKDGLKTIFTKGYPSKALEWMSRN